MIQSNLSKLVLLSGRYSSNKPSMAPKVTDHHESEKLHCSSHARQRQKLADDAPVCSLKALFSSDNIGASQLKDKSIRRKMAVMGGGRIAGTGQRFQLWLRETLPR